MNRKMNSKQKKQLIPISLLCLFFLFMIGTKDAGASTVSQDVDYFTVDGIEYSLTPFFNPNDTFVTIRGLQEEVWDLAINGCLVLPSCVT